MNKLLFTSLALVLTALNAQAATHNISSGTTDQERYGDGGSNWVGQSTSNIGKSSVSGNAFIFVFELPTLAPGETISSANFSTYVSSNGNIFNGTDSVWNIDLYGVRTSDSSTVLAADFFMEANDTSATKIQDNFWADLNSASSAPAVGEHSTSIAGDSALTAWLNSLYTGTTPNQTYAFMRLNADKAPTEITNSRFVTIQTGNGTNLPVLQITSAIPEPSSYATLVGFSALGFVMLRRRRA